MASALKITERIQQSLWTKLYIILALMQGIMIVAIQAAIASQNTTQASNIYAITEPGRTSTLLNLSSPATASIKLALDRFNRIKWENVAFIGFQVWFVGMAFDATVYQNAAEVIVLAILNGICAILGGLEVMDGKRWLTRIRDLADNNNIIIDTHPLQIAVYLEITLTVLQVLYALIFAYLSYRVVKEFGWVIYKKIGPDVNIQKMYRTFQFFVLALKIDIFIEFLVSCFYIIQFAIEDGFKWDAYIQIIVTILIIPILSYGRMTVAAEHHGRMLLFILFQFAIVFSLILMLWRTLLPNNNWYTWIVFVILGILFALSTSILGVWCMTNFEKGLAPYVQRGRRKRDQERAEKELRDQSSARSWRIDDE